MRRIVFDTDPPDVRVFQVDPSPRAIGESGTPVPVTLPSAGDAVTLEFSADGFDTRRVNLSASVLRSVDRFPTGTSPIELTPNNAWVPYQVWIRHHPAQAAGTGLALGLCLVGAGLWTRQLVQAQRHVRKHEGRVVVRIDRLGTHMGGYRLEERIGEGGTAEVYRATGPRGPAAVKVVELEKGKGSVSQQRFLREVQVLQKLVHPHIVQFYDWGTVGDAMYLVEELVPGGNIRERVPRGGMNVREFLTWFTPLLDAVAFAHRQGVIHRDLKPENVLLTTDGQVKVSDFGLARVSDSALTVNNVMGTPLYMAPEQFAGQVATAATDQYTLGILAFEMLSGQVPFSGESVSELMARRTKPPPSLPPAVPASLSRVVYRMLSRAPEERYASLDSVAEQLRQVERDA